MHRLHVLIILLAEKQKRNDESKISTPSRTARRTSPGDQTADSRRGLSAGNSDCNVFNTTQILHSTSTHKLGYATKFMLICQGSSRALPLILFKTVITLLVQTSVISRGGREQYSMNDCSLRIRLLVYYKLRNPQPCNINYTYLCIYMYLYVSINHKLSGGVFFILET